MPRRAARVDENQPAIVAAFQALGASVQHLHMVGGGCTDLVIGYRGVNLMVEVKDGDKPPSKQSLTPAQKVWHDAWRGQVAIVNSVDAAIALLKSLDP